MLLLKQKRGWIRIVEAFVAVLLITGVVLLVINKGYIAREDISDKVYDAQWAVLREIELNDGLRYDILSTGSGEGDAVPESVRTKILDRMPDYLECISKICELNELCEISNPDYLPTEKDVYAQPITIAATPGVAFDPKQLKMFCWVK